MLCCSISKHILCEGKKGAKSKREKTKWRNLIREVLERITHSENSWMTAAMWVMRVRTPTSSLQPSTRKERKNVEKQLSWVSAEHKSSLKVKFENETCYDLFRVINNNLEDLVHLKEKKKKANACYSFNEEMLTRGYFSMATWGVCMYVCASCVRMRR